MTSGEPPQYQPWDVPRPDQTIPGNPPAAFPPPQQPHAFPPKRQPSKAWALWVALGAVAVLVIIVGVAIAGLHYGQQQALQAPSDETTSQAPISSRASTTTQS